jgi:6-phosphogluconolactonase
MGVKIFPTPYQLAEKFADELVRMSAEFERAGSFMTIALSGGSTPELLYSVIGDHFSNAVRWDIVHFFWGDERCVPPDNSDSNFGMTRRLLLEKINIPESNIHRIKGENDPDKEVIRYSREIEEHTRNRDGMPVFNLIILGLGEDGHTASIFPSDTILQRAESICEITVHPVTMQKRITLTARVINNADRVDFLVTGTKKAEIVDKILNNKFTRQNFPASLIVPVYGELSWFLDTAAASLL